MSISDRARDLLPCPFCGGEALIEPKNWCGRDYIGVFCKECLIFQDSRSATEAEATAAWNTRALSSPVGEGDELVERLRGLGDDAEKRADKNAMQAEVYRTELDPFFDRVAHTLREAADRLSTPPHDRATIRREAFEEAAKVARNHCDAADKCATDEDAHRKLQEIPFAIRALKETPDVHCQVCGVGLTPGDTIPCDEPRCPIGD